MRAVANPVRGGGAPSRSVSQVAASLGVSLALAASSLVGAVVTGVGLPPAAASVCTADVTGLIWTCAAAGTDTVAVPAGAVSVDIVVNGGGGGAPTMANDTYFIPADGGAGARVAGSLDLTGGAVTSLDVVVGAGGGSDALAGFGGEFSSVRSTISGVLTDIAIAGGGGGGAYLHRDEGSIVSRPTGGVGAAGGTANGGNGGNADVEGRNGGGGEGGASGTGGAKGSGTGETTYLGSDGSAYTLGTVSPGGDGGAGGSYGNPRAGSGGSGYGGGGGGAFVDWGNGGGGGAGGSYADTSLLTSVVFSAQGGAGGLVSTTNSPATSAAGQAGSITLTFFASPPDAPTALVATPGNGQASIAFTPGFNGGSAITDYEYELDSSGTWVSSGATASPIIITGLVNGTTYSIRLRAVNSVGDSAASSVVNITPVAPAPSGGGGGGGGTTATPTPSASPTPTPAPVVDPLLPGNVPGVAAFLPPTGLPAARSLLVVNGQQVPVTVKPNAKTLANATALDVDGPGFTMKLAGRGDVNDPLGLTEKQALILQSEPVAARSGLVSRSGVLAKTKVQPMALSSGTGFKPNSEVRLFLLADTYLGTLPTDAAGNAPSGEVRSLSLGVVVKGASTAQATRSAKANVFFAPLSAQLSTAGKTKLNGLVKRTGKNGVKTAVVGFVQPVGPTGNDQTLSKARAQAVASYLRGKGLKGAYVVRGDGRASETGAEARRVEVTVAFRK